LAGALLPASPAQALSAPVLTGQAGAGGPAGSVEPEDVAQLSGTTAATGRIVFRLYGPDDPSCTSAPAHTPALDVAGNGSYAGTDFLYVYRAGPYRFIAAYSGDAQNQPVATACDDPAQQFTVTINQSQLAGTASGSVVAGGQISDTARV